MLYKPNPFFHAQTRHTSAQNQFSLAFTSVDFSITRQKSNLEHCGMDPPNTGDILRHLEKQNELLMDAYNSQSHKLHKLQVEEEMLMRKFYELMSAHGLAKRQESGGGASEDDGLIGQSTSAQQDDASDRDKATFHCISSTTLQW